MKSIIIIIALLTAQIACASDWARVDVSTGLKESPVYIDVESIDKANPLTSFWIKTVDPSKNETHKNRIIINCDEKKIIMTDSYTYDIDDHVVFSFQDSVWRAVVPDTISDHLYRLSCVGNGSYDAATTTKFVKYKIKNFRKAYFDSLKKNEK